MMSSRNSRQLRDTNGLTLDLGAYGGLERSGHYEIDSLASNDSNLSLSRM